MSRTSSTISRIPTILQISIPAPIPIMPSIMIRPLASRARFDDLALLMLRMTLSPSSGRLLPSPSAGGHFPTFFRTAAAGLGTATAMFVLVLLAFCGTRVANRGANAAELCDESGIPANECRAIPALVRAIDAESCAFRHLAEALIAAGFALLRASDTGFHARLILMSHWRILLCVNKCCETDEQLTATLHC